MLKLGLTRNHLDVKEIVTIFVVKNVYINGRKKIP